MRCSRGAVPGEGEVVLFGGGLVPEEGGQLEKEPVWGGWCPPTTPPPT